MSFWKIWLFTFGLTLLFFGLLGILVFLCSLIPKSYLIPIALILLAVTSVAASIYWDQS